MSLYKLSLRLKGFKIGRAIEKLRELHALPPVDFRVRLEEMRTQIVQFHLQNNSFYHEKINARGRGFSSFEDLPIITKRDLQQPLDKLLSKGYSPKNSYVASTSGSTGIPLYFAKDKKSHAFSHAILMDCYAQWGVKVSDKQARFYGIPLAGKSRYIELLKDFLMNRKRFPVFDLSDETLSLYLKEFERIRFKYIYGYTSAIVLFAKYLISREIVLNDLCPSLKCCIVTSEVCTEEDRTIMSSAFGVPIVREYGASETSIIAFEYPDTGWKIVDENVYVEIVDNNGNPLPLGEEGRVLVTSLTNKAFPVIRYEIGDMGILESREDVLLLKNLVGRVSDMIELPSGKVAAGLTFYYVSRSLLENMGIIKEFIVRQIAIDTFVFDVVSDRDFTAAEVEFLEKQIEDYLEPGISLLVNRVEEIKRPSSGKIKHFYSMLEV